MPGQALDQRLVAQVTASALAFMAPRTLEPVPVWQLALWGLRGLTTLDPRLTVGAARRHAAAEHRRTASLAARAPPAPDDADGWGEATAQLVRAGWDASEAVRRAGTQGDPAQLLRRAVQPPRPLFALCPAGRGRRRPGCAAPGGPASACRLARRGGGFVVQEVAADGPAAQAGVRAGDRILAVDGQTTQGADLDVGDRAARRAGGHAGVGVAARPRRADAAASTLARALVPPETVVADAGRRPAGAAGHRLRQRHRRRGWRTRSSAAWPARAPPRGMVLDLRGNRGGLLRQAVAAAGTLLPTGVVAITAGRDPAAAHEFRAEGTRPRRTACRWWCWWTAARPAPPKSWPRRWPTSGRAVVVGSATLGKGLVQTIAPLPDGGELLVTWSRVLAPLRLADPGARRAAAGLHQPGRRRADAGNWPSWRMGGQPMARALRPPPRRAGAAAAGGDAGDPQRLPGRRGPRHRPGGGAAADRDAGGLCGGAAAGPAGQRPAPAPSAGIPALTPAARDAR